MEGTVRKNLHERRDLAIVNTRKTLVFALYQLEEATKYPDLTCPDARRALIHARRAIEDAALFADFGIDGRR